MQVLKFVIPEIIFGRGALAQAGEATRRLGAVKPLLVCDPGVAAAGWLDHLVSHLDEQDLAYVIWSGFTSNPKDVEVEEGVAIYHANNCDAIIGLGGGSAIDAAKAVAVLSTNGGMIRDYEGIDRMDRPLPPLVMLPTTAGSASDVSQFAAIKDTRRQSEMTLISRTLSPDISITDPSLLTTLDAWQTAVTGIDALTHGIEAYLSRAATFLTDRHALEAIRLVFAYLPASVERRDDLDVKEAMARASLHAGLASSNAILGAAHAIANQVGGLRDQVHGEINAALLPAVMTFNQPVVPQRVAMIAEAIGVDTGGMSVDQAGAAAIEAVRKLIRTVGLTRRLHDLGVDEANIPLLSRRALHDACMVTNPRAASEDEIASLLRDAL